MGVEVALITLLAGPVYDYLISFSVFFVKTTDRRHRFVVAFCTVTFAARVPQNVTAVAPAKLVPVIVTLVPPAVRPELGLTLVRLKNLAKVSLSLSPGANKGSRLTRPRLGISIA